MRQESGVAEGIVVEAATAGDLRPIIAMDPRVADTPGRREFLEHAHAASECIVARRGGELAGFAVFGRSFFGQPFIELLYVEPEQRRGGVARAIVRHIESICRSEKLFTSTNESNAAMHAFCAALGFERSGRIENLDEGDPEIVYFKRVAPANTHSIAATTESRR